MAVRIEAGARAGRRVLAAAAVALASALVGFALGRASAREESAERREQQELETATLSELASVREQWDRGFDRAFALVQRRRHLELVDEALRALPRPVPRGADPRLAADLDAWALVRLELRDEAGARARFDEARALDADAERGALRDEILAGDTFALLERARAPDCDERPAPTRRLLARGLATLANDDAAIRLLERAADRDPADAATRLLLGEILFRGGPPAGERARVHLGAARALRPDSIRIAVLLGTVVAESCGEPSDAVAVLVATARRSPDDPVVGWALGMSLFRARHHEEAREALRRALELEPRFVLAHTALGEIALDQAELGRAERAFRRSLEFADTPDAHDGLGSVLWLRDEQAAAIELLEKAVRRHPDDALLRDRLATSLVQVGRFAEGLAQLREAAHLDPWLAEVQNDYAWELVNSGDPALRRPGVALEHTQRACELEPWNAWYRNTLAVTWYRLGEYERCVAELEDIRDLPRGGGPYDLFFLAMAKQKLGQRADAVELFERAVALMPEGNDELVRLKAEAEETIAAGGGP